MSAGEHAKRWSSGLSKGEPSTEPCVRPTSDARNRSYLLKDLALKGLKNGAVMFFKGAQAFGKRPPGLRDSPA